MHWRSVLSFPLAAMLGAVASATAAVAQLPTLDDAAIESEQKRFASEAGVNAPCAMPKASDTARVVVLRASAESLATVTIGSQDISTRTGAIVVDAGREPLYLIVTAMSPTIWRISGATERIERLVMAGFRTGPNRGVPGEPPLIGATGVPRERTSFLRHPYCLHLHEPSNTWIETVDRLVKHEIGRENVRRGAFAELSEVSVPSFTYKSLRQRPMPMVEYSRSNSGMVVIEGDPKSRVTISGRNDLNEEFKLFAPGGVTAVDARAVVASAPAEPYEVLPQQAGLMQLMQSGALSRDDEGDFIIEKKIRLPAELISGHRFRLRPGVPEPDGYAGFGCVLSEETGAALNGGRC
jgi:hypothetical protein